MEARGAGGATGGGAGGAPPQPASCGTVWRYRVFSACPQNTTGLGQVAPRMEALQPLCVHLHLLYQDTHLP